MTHSRTPCTPPQDTLRFAKRWWIREHPYGSADKPEERVWQWNPVVQAWNKPGEMATLNQRDYSPQEFVGYEILGEAIAPGIFMNMELSDAINIMQDLCDYIASQHSTDDSVVPPCVKKAKQFIGHHPALVIPKKS